MLENQLSINVIGTGYVGLPAAILLADVGHKVVGIDIDENVVRAINDGVLHIDEEELAGIMSRESVRKNLTATNKPIPADVYIVAVPTPLDERKKVADLSILVRAVRSIAEVMPVGSLVIIESTIPPLTCREVVENIFLEFDHILDQTYDLAHCPERILPGNVFHEIVNNDRIIGSRTQQGRQRAANMYSSFVKGELLLTDDITAELTKLTENAARDVGIAFANEISEVASRLGVDPSEVISLANRHPRISILKPGIGVGGHCIPIDPWFIKQIDPVNTSLIVTSRKINDERPQRMADRVRRAVSKLDRPKILLVGATYKPDTYDLRESPAISVFQLLRNDGYDVVQYDPIVPDLKFKPSLTEASRGFDAVFILVAHKCIINEIESNQGKSNILSSMRGDIFMSLP